MYQGIYKIADQIIEIRSLYQYVHKLCRNYIYDGTPYFTVVSSPEDIIFERDKSARENILEGLPVHQFPEDYLETLSVYRKIADNMLSRDTLLFHGSVIAVDGEAFLFTATSGTGKSTHTRLWREQLGSRAFMVNDDKPLIRILPGEVTVFGTPWDGKHHLSTNTSVPLKAICVLKRGSENTIREITPREVLPMLMQQSHRPSVPGNMPLYLDLMDHLSKGVRFYELHCNMDPEAARVSYEGMSGKPFPCKEARDI